MLFNSLTFVVFYVIVTMLYWSFNGWNLRKNLLVVASYIFYGAWNPPFAALLFSTTAMDFWLGRQIGKAQGHAKRKWLVASVCMNLSMLGFFKYGNFPLQNSNGWWRALVSFISRRISIFFCPSAFPFTRSIRFLTRSTFTAAYCNRRDRCAISFSRSRFSRSWSPGRSCARAIFFRNSSTRRASRRTNFSGASLS